MCACVCVCVRVRIRYGAWRKLDEMKANWHGDEEDGAPDAPRDDAAADGMEAAADPREGNRERHAVRSARRRSGTLRGRERLYGAA